MRERLVVIVLPLLAAPAAVPAQEFRDCAACGPMIVIPAGRFWMGSDDGEADRPEGPRRRVTIARPFALGKYEVTVAEFRRFVDATGHRIVPGCRVQQSAPDAQGKVGWREDSTASWQAPGVELWSDAAPVVCVGRIDALAFTQWLAAQTGRPYRLPSEAEWEYAAGGGRGTLYPWGNNIDRGCEYANLYDRSARRAYDFGWSHADCDDGYPGVAPVGRFKPNRFGLYDMTGNVWEWVADCYRPTYAAAPRDGRPVLPQGPCELWAVRGGGWMTRPSRQRISFRGRDPQDARYNFFGFRVARDLNALERRRAREPQ
ncbi:MAG: formylglycine-generating enzyme family protein [Steroidobacteraceae bacterium]|nr:formylglycine-generating enzyme family protein [Steroidobacteraceae bacterium]MDW8260651.1 formylglycine-generating enzyme family protein [Gammaproteobacteria bacterium]